MIMKKEITWQKLVYIFILGCLLGFGVETLWHLMKNHVFINKQGLLYGPFKPIYGFGAVLFTLALNKIHDKNVGIIFLYGTLIGTVFEFFCSFIQEFLWGTYTWTYANFKYSISSRIYLPYCLLWGLLAIAWIKWTLPLINKLIDKISPRISNLLATIILVFMIFNLIMTGLAMDRFSERYYGQVARNKLETWIDKQYNDEVMHKKFPKLRIVNKEKA